MTRQPWLFANSRTSSSDMSLRTRSSAGCVTTYSDRFERASPILAARAGKSLRIRSGSSDYPCHSCLERFSSKAEAAAAWVYDLVAALGRYQLCVLAEGHGRLG